MDDENENDDIANTSMTQTLPKKEGWMTGFFYHHIEDHRQLNEGGEFTPILWLDKQNNTAQFTENNLGWEWRRMGYESTDWLSQVQDETGKY